MKIEDTKTATELQRIGAYDPDTTNVGENMFTPSFDEDDGTVVLWDGQIHCWGADDELAEALSDLPEGADFEDIWDVLGDFPSNA